MCRYDINSTISMLTIHCTYYGAKNMLQGANIEEAIKNSFQKVMLSEKEGVICLR